MSHIQSASADDRVRAILRWFLYKHDLDPHGRQELKPECSHSPKQPIYRWYIPGAQVALYKFENEAVIVRYRGDKTPDQWWDELKEVFDHYLVGYKVSLVRERVSESASSYPWGTWRNSGFGAYGGGR